MKILEEQTGMPLKDISSERAAEKISFLNITSQPREVIPTAVFPGSNKQGQRYSPFTTNIERLVPFRTLTGRQKLLCGSRSFPTIWGELTSI